MKTQRRAGMLRGSHQQARSTSESMDVVSVMGGGRVWSTAKETMEVSIATGKGAICSLF